MEKYFFFPPITTPHPAVLSHRREVRQGPRWRPDRIRKKNFSRTDRRDNPRCRGRSRNGIPGYPRPAEVEIEFFTSFVSESNNSLPVGFTSTDL